MSLLFYYCHTISLAVSVGLELSGACCRNWGRLRRWRHALAVYKSARRRVAGETEFGIQSADTRDASRVINRTAPHRTAHEYSVIMPATEKDLADDAPWKKIQQNTFTRWCNEHLKSANKRVADLQLDLSDGLRLISLLEVLSQKKMYRKYHARPTFRQMKLENVSVALEFLERR